VTVHASDLALFYLRHQALGRCGLNYSGYRSILFGYVVELEHEWVGLTAVDTWMLKKVRVNDQGVPRVIPVGVRRDVGHMLLLMVVVPGSLTVPAVELPTKRARGVEIGERTR